MPSPKPQFHTPHKSMRHPTTGKRIAPARVKGRRAGLMLAVAAPLIAAAGVGLWVASQPEPIVEPATTEQVAPTINNNVNPVANSTDDLIRDAAGIPDDPTHRLLITD